MPAEVISSSSTMFMTYRLWQIWVRENGGAHEAARPVAAHCVTRAELIIQIDKTLADEAEKDDVVTWWPN